MKSVEIKESNVAEVVVGVCFLIGLFLPHINAFLMLFNIFMCIFLYINYKGKCNPKLTPFKIILIISLLISFVVNLPTLNLGGKAILTFAYILLLFYTFPMIGSVRIRNMYLYISLSIILLSQLVFVINYIPGIFLIDILYPVPEEDLNQYEYFVNEAAGTLSQSLSLRNSGLFRNPNQTSKYLCLILACFLLENKKMKLKKFLFFIPACFLSIIMTGSRTGLVVSSLLIVTWTFYNRKIKKGYKAFALFCFFIIASIIAFGKTEIRGANISDGLEKSANVKFDILSGYLNSDVSVLSFFWGNIDSNDIHFDSEYGFFIFNYGVIGFVLYLIFWYKMFKSTNKTDKIVYLFLLWMVSSTIMLSYRCAFVAMLMFSRFYSESYCKIRMK